MELTIVNKKEIDAFISRCVDRGHTCVSIKRIIHGDKVNKYWVNTSTGESIEIIYAISGDTHE